MLPPERERHLGGPGVTAIARGRLALLGLLALVLAACPSESEAPPPETEPAAGDTGDTGVDPVEDSEAVSDVGATSDTARVPDSSADGDGERAVDARAPSDGEPVVDVALPPDVSPGDAPPIPDVEPADPGPSPEDVPAIADPGGPSDDPGAVLDAGKPADAGPAVDTGPKISPFLPVPPSPTACAVPPEPPPKCTSGVELTYDGPAFPLGQGYWDGVYTDGYLLAGGGPSGLNVWDMSNPAEPVLAGTHTKAAFSPILADGYLYANGGFSGLGVYDISVPTKPELLGAGPLTGKLQAVEGGRAYTVSESLVSYDVTDPSEITMQGVWFHEDTAVIVAGAAAGIAVFRSAEVSSPSGFGYTFGVVDFRAPVALDAKLIYGHVGESPVPGSVGGFGVSVTVHHQSPEYWHLTVSTAAGHSRSGPASSSTRRAATRGWARVRHAGTSTSCRSGPPFRRAASRRTPSRSTCTARTIPTWC